MRTDQSYQKGAEDGMNANNAGEESRGQSQEHGQGNDGLGRSILYATGPVENPHQGRSHGVDEEEDVGYGGEQYVEGSDTRAGVDQGDTEGE